MDVHTCLDDVCTPGRLLHNAKVGGDNGKISVGEVLSNHVGPEMLDWDRETVDKIPSILFTG